jgi:ABC-2 type transport system permease protein
VKSLLVARKSLLEIIREPTLLGLVILMPLVFVGIAAFGYSAPFLVTHPLWVIVQAEGDLGLIEALRAEQYPDSRAVFDVAVVTDQDAAQIALAEREITALVEVGAGADGRPMVTVHGDALYGRFYRAGVVLDEVVQRYADRLAGRGTLVQIREERYAPAGPENEFDYYAPGMMVFALLMIIPQTAMLVGRELRWGTLRRLRLSRIRAWELLGGISLAQMAVAVIQVLVVFISAQALGYNNHGSLILAVFVGLAISLSAVGMGLIVACFIENDSQAVNLGSTVTMVQVFVSGAFFPLPPLTVITFLGHPIGLFDIFPASHGMLALQQVLNDGAGLGGIGFRLAAIILLSGLTFVAGVFTFHRLKMGRGSRV